MGLPEDKVQSLVPALCTRPFRSALYKRRVSSTYVHSDSDIGAWFGGILGLRAFNSGKPHTHTHTHKST